MRSEEAIINFSQVIEHEGLNDFSLTIYYLELTILTQMPVTEFDLIDGLHDYKITIPGYRLQDYADIFRQIDNAPFIPVEEESHMDARVLYVFENPDGKEVLRVSMWGRNRSMFVNGNQVEEESIFYDVIMPFLPEHIAQELQAWIDRN